MSCAFNAVGYQPDLPKFKSGVSLGDNYSIVKDVGQAPTLHGCPIIVSQWLHLCVFVLCGLLACIDDRT